MRWQKIARLAIAVFVVVFAAIVFYAMRQRSTAPVRTGAVPPREAGAMSTSGPGVFESHEKGKLNYAIQFKSQSSYKDGRTKIHGVTLTLPDRNGRTFTVTSDEAEVVAPPEKPQDLNTAKLTGNVKLTTDNGVVVTAGHASYDNSTGILTVPGPVDFTRGRMKGTGVGATYDKTRDVLWLLAQAHVTVAPDAAGAGAADATAESAGLARAENYVRLTKNARIVTEGRTIEAAEITAHLDQAGEKIQQMQLRGQSRIVGSGAAAQTMTANDIDLTYAPDGRTLQTAKLMENSVVELPGTAGAAGRRIAGRTIDIAMAPDGSTVTSLNATEKVQVNLPAEGDIPGKEIHSATLKASGAPGQGLQNATFDGSVVYSETRAAQDKLPAVNRESRSMRLIIDTKPGLGPVERADFHGNVRFTDKDTVAEAPRAVYSIERDLLELSPSAGDPGTGPTLSDGQLRIDARNIQLSPSSGKLKADTDVRSVIQPQRRPVKTDPAGRGASQARVPSMFNGDKPVNVTSNRVEYDGVSEATYNGSAILWQDRSRIAADTLVLNDQTGNLTARQGVRTTMMLESVDQKTRERVVTQTNATADLMVYDDAKRLATYTATGSTRARLTGAQGDLHGNRIDLYLKEGGSELERAEADTNVEVTDVKLIATGAHMVYTAADDTYVMTGTPVVAIQKDENNQCKQTDGTTLTYIRPVDRLRVDAMPGLPFKSTALPSCPAKLRH
jgi:LPS export ABC transporter protein LptC